MDVKVHGPDYDKFEDKELAAKDFMKRIEHYEEVYETIENEELDGQISYIKVINAGAELVIHKHNGPLQARIGYWLMNTHITKRKIYLTRHGESELNVVGQRVSKRLFCILIIIDMIDRSNWRRS